MGRGDKTSRLSVEESRRGRFRQDLSVGDREGLCWFVSTGQLRCVATEAAERGGPGSRLSMEESRRGRYWADLGSRSGLGRTETRGLG
jgi:hypothetical protein